MNLALDASTDAERWDAVARRDPHADGVFVYGVKTTGVFCRPSCHSRLPNRENVVWFDDSEAASRAGYRACKRCKPTAPQSPPAGESAVLQACQMIEEADEPPGLEELASAVGLSPFYFHRMFKSVIGVTPKGYAEMVRTRRLREALAAGGGGTVTQAIYRAGFASSGRCYESAGQTLGMTPSAYQNGAAGLVISHAVAQSRLGWILVAATGRGLCTVEFGDSPDALRASLKRRFPRANLQSDDPQFASWVAEVVTRIDESRSELDLPLDVQGTAFQRRVWEALREIPRGSTASYAEVATRIGQPTATRAVASACAANPVAVVIPCHRVVRSDGKPGGYHWGLERKRALLEQEAAAEATESTGS